MGQLEGQTGLVIGVANKRSAAWGIAQALHKEGMRLAFTYQGERLKDTVSELAASLDPAAPVMPLDVSYDDQIEAVFRQVEETFGGLHTLVHSIGFAPQETFHNPFVETQREAFARTLDINAYSLVALARAAAPLMERSGGGSIITMTFLGGERVVPKYNLMGIAKAALEASVKYLAHDLGPRKIRVNAISAGPLRTLAGRSIPGFPLMEKHVYASAPLREGVDVEEVGQLAAFLASPASRLLTGETIHLDAGYHVMGIMGPLE